MKFSKRSRYGIQALIDLGIYAKTECVQLKDVSERNDISVKYLEQIFTALRKAGCSPAISEYCAGLWKCIARSNP